MKIRFVTRESVASFGERVCAADADVLCFPLFDDVVVNYEQELRGESGYFEEAAILSKEAECVVACGYTTSTHGVLRSSALVAERGRILGVSDALTSVDGDKNCGAYLKVYDTQCGRIGVAVGTDAYVPEIFRTLSACGSEYVLCLFGANADGTERILLRAAALSYGVPVCLCAKGYAFVSDTDGETAFSSPYSPVCCSIEKNGEYHLTEYRLRGFKKRDGGKY